MALEHFNWLEGTDKDPVLKEFVEKRSGYADRPPVPYALPRQANIISYKDDIDLAIDPIDLSFFERIGNLPDGRKILVDSKPPEHKGDPVVVYFYTTKPRLN